MKTFTDFVVALNLLTLGMIGYSTWLAWKTQEQRHLQAQEVQALKERVASVEGQLLVRTTKTQQQPECR